MPDRAHDARSAITAEIEALEAEILAEMVRSLGAPDTAEVLQSLAMGQRDQAARARAQRAGAAPSFAPR